MTGTRPVSSGPTPNAGRLLAAYGRGRKWRGRRWRCSRRYVATTGSSSCRCGPWRTSTRCIGGRCGRRWATRSRPSGRSRCGSHRSSTRRRACSTRCSRQAVQPPRSARRDARRPLAVRTGHADIDGNGSLASALRCPRASTAASSWASPSQYAASTRPAAGDCASEGFSPSSRTPPSMIQQHHLDDPERHRQRRWASAPVPERPDAPPPSPGARPHRRRCARPAPAAHPRTRSAATAARGTLPPGPGPDRDPGTPNTWLARGRPPARPRRPPWPTSRPGVRPGAPAPGAGAGRPARRLRSPSPRQMCLGDRALVA